MFKFLLEIIYPKRCVGCRRFGSFLCSNCFSYISYNQYFSCPICLRPSVDGFSHPRCLAPHSINGAIPVVLYRKTVKKLVYQFKYEPYLSSLSKVVGQLMTEGLSQNESFHSFITRHNPILLPIPLSQERLRTRGYNHAELLANYVAQYFKLETANSILLRKKDTKPQYKLSKKQRLTNIRGAFGIDKNKKIPENVILIDDIATTFATLKEATKVLKRNGVKNVLGITFAKEG